MKITFLIIFIFLQLSLSAQKDIKGIVYFGHKQSFGMGAPIGIDYNAVLIFDINNSTYTFAKDSIEGGHIQEMNHIKNDNRHFMIMKKTTEEGLVYNLNTSTNLIKSRDVGFNYVKDTIPKIDWKISNETKEIGNFECTKATANFRGRDYTAWFTFSIPLPYGPWKLQGLPGLVLEAYDTDKEIYFYFKSIEYPSKRKLEIDIPNPDTNMDMERNRPTTERRWISFDEFKKEMIKRHKIGTKVGRMAMEETQSILTAKARYPMKNVYIEIFD